MHLKTLAQGRSHARQALAKAKPATTSPNDYGAKIASAAREKMTQAQASIRPFRTLAPEVGKMAPADSKMFVRQLIDGLDPTGQRGALGEGTALKRLHGEVSAREFQAGTVTVTARERRSATDYSETVRHFLVRDAKIPNTELRIDVNSKNVVSSRQVSLASSEAGVYWTSSPKGQTTSFAVMNLPFGKATWRSTNGKTDELFVENFRGSGLRLNLDPKGAKETELRVTAAGEKWGSAGPRAQALATLEGRGVQLTSRSNPDEVTTYYPQRAAK